MAVFRAVEAGPSSAAQDRIKASEALARLRSARSAKRTGMASPWFVRLRPVHASLDTRSRYATKQKS
jgi:hypothetical protein